MTYLSINLSIPNNQSIFPSIRMSIYIYLFILLSIHLFYYLSIYSSILSLCISISLTINPSIYSSIHFLSIYPSIHLFIYHIARTSSYILSHLSMGILCIYPSIHLSIYPLSIYLSLPRHTFHRICQWVSYASQLDTLLRWPSGFQRTQPEIKVYINKNYH